MNSYIKMFKDFEESYRKPTQMGVRLYYNFVLCKKPSKSFVELEENF